MSERTIRVPLIRLCLARSGDKGDTANIGVIARSEAIYAWMLDHLTPAFVKRYFDDVCDGEVDRFEFPNLLAVNFLASCRSSCARSSRPSRTGRG